MKINKTRGKLTITTILTLAMVLSVFLPTTVLAAGTSTPTPPPASSTPTPTPTPTGGSIYISGYNIVDGDTGVEVLNFLPDVKALAAFSIVDERIEDSKIPQDADLAQYIHAKVVADNFTPVSGTDVRYKRRSAVDGKLSYTISFNDTMYKGTGKTAFSFDVSTTTVDQNSFPNAPIVTLTQNISQAMDKKADAASSVKPTIMVKSSSYGAEQVKAGAKFTLDLTSYNTSKSEDVSSVTTTIELPKELTLAGGSNSILTDTVKAGASFKNSFELMAQSNAETSVANITVKYSFYTKGAAEPLQASQMITVAIVQPDRFSFTSVQVPPEMFVGEENTISLGYVNKGKSILYNVSAEIAGNIKNPGQAQFFGELKPGSEGSADFVIMSDTQGTVSGTITLTYEDINGNVTTQKKEYSVNITENKNGNMMDGGMVNGGVMMGPDGMPMDPNADMSAQGGFPWWGWVIIVIAVIAVAVTVIVVLKKKKAKKLEAMLAEDDE